jgi:hypothetical protein
VGGIQVFFRCGGLQLVGFRNKLIVDSLALLLTSVAFVPHLQMAKNIWKLSGIWRGKLLFGEGNCKPVRPFPFPYAIQRAEDEVTYLHYW